jgi:cytochrome c biogenesis protein
MSISTQRGAHHRPEGHLENPGESTANVTMPQLGFAGWMRWSWRQLTSMRTALFLLLLLALGAIPGSLFPQRTADPNGVLQYFKANPEQARFLDALQAFNVYTSVWFSAIYLLLFVSLVGCVIPRLKHHWIALFQAPPLTPKNLSRLPAYHRRTVSGGEEAESQQDLLSRAETDLRRLGYRVRWCAESAGADRLGQVSSSLSSERGYLRESGNLLFHFALIGVLATVLIGGSYQYTGERVVVEGQTFVNTRAAYDSFNPGRLFSDAMLDPYSVTLNKFTVTYAKSSRSSMGMVTDYNANVTTTRSSRTTRSRIKVNDPLAIGGDAIYLLGNGYAPQITVRNAKGVIVFNDTIPFLPQDTNLTSLGVIKVPDGLNSQVGMIGFFYPTEGKQANGTFSSVYPDLVNPVLSLNVFTGDLGLNSGTPKSVYSLDTSRMTQIAGRTSAVAALQLTPGKPVALPRDLGTVELKGVKRFASFQVTHDPTQIWMFIFALLILAGLGAGLFIPRRRVWVRVTDMPDHDRSVEYAALARGDDPRLRRIIDELSDRHRTSHPNSMNRNEK